MENTPILARLLIAGSCLIGIIMAQMIIDRYQIARYRMDCDKNLKLMGLAFKMYAGESNGSYYPVLKNEVGKLTFNIDEIVPEYLNDSTMLHCPADSSIALYTLEYSAVTELKSYWYLGAGVWDERSGKAYIQLYKDWLKEPGGKGFLDFESVELMESNPLNQPPVNIKRMKEVHSRFYLGDPPPPYMGAAQSQIPLLIERPGHHKGGAHVLFMDGHVELIPYPGKFPMTEEFISALNELDALGL